MMGTWTIGAFAAAIALSAAAMAAERFDLTGSYEGLPPIRFFLP
jgi:hypothetical protein